MKNNASMPAHPVTGEDGETLLAGDYHEGVYREDCVGLTKLEYAAIQMMSGALERYPDMVSENIVKMVVSQAKALLTELEKEHGE